MLLPLEGLGTLSIRIASHAAAGEIRMLTWRHYEPQFGNSQLFRSTSLSQQDIGEPGSWCIAQIER